MTTILQFAILGLGIGTAYTLLAQGIVLIYRGTGVINFSHGAMAMLGSYLFWELKVSRGWTFAPAAAVAIVAIAALGVLLYLGIMRPLRHASAMTRVVATLGLLLLLQGIVNLKWGAAPKSIVSSLPDGLWDVGGVTVGQDKILLLLIAVALTVALWAFSRYAPLGLAIRANAENPRATSTLGWSPTLLGAMTWGVGSSLAATAGILISPMTGVNLETMPLLVIPVLAAALVGRMSSFGVTCFGAIVIGIAQSEALRYVHLAGAAEAVPFLTIIALLLVRRTSLTTRSQLQEQLPAIGTGRINVPVVAVAVVAAILLFNSVLPEDLVIALGATVTWGIVLLSIVLLLGYTGQLSLAQFAIGGIAALIAGRLVSDRGMPFLAASAIAIVATVVIGLVFAVPALRTRGISLAVVTLGLATTVSAMVFNNVDLTGGVEGTAVGTQSLFGINMDTIVYPRRYAIFTLVVFVVCALVVANVRRGTAGRRLIAVRTNERAAAALGINVLGAKLYAFGLAAALAAVGGILLAFRNTTILYNDYDAVHSMFSLGYAVVGGVGFIFGAPTGGTLADVGFGGWLQDRVFPSASPAWLEVVGGATILAFTVLNPDGMVGAQIHQINAVRKKLFRRKDRVAPEAEEPTTQSASRPPATRVEGKVLEVSGLVVRFGGVTAVNGASLTVRPGQIVGLIGPNGAGKTTLVDAVTGFVPLAEGHITLDGERIDGNKVYRRTRAGISRSFQSLELFENGTVRENLAIASDPGSPAAYVTDLVLPRRGALSAAAMAAVAELQLGDHLDDVVSDLPYGRRRLVAIARAVATQPSVLLLDEPAAGLSESETRELGATVRRLADEWDIGILVIEHDMSFVMAVCDSLVVLDFGRQIASGSPDAVRRDPAVRAAYLGVETSTVSASSTPEPGRPRAEVAAPRGGEA